MSGGLEQARGHLAAAVAELEAACRAWGLWADEVRVLPDIRGEHGGVIGVEQVLMLKSPARRSRAGLGVQGVAGMVSLSR